MRSTISTKETLKVVAVILVTVSVAIYYAIYYFARGMPNPSSLEHEIAGSQWFTARGNQGMHGRGLDLGRWDNQKGVPHLAVAICGDRLEEPLTMLKSAVLFAKSFLIIHVIADSQSLKDKVKTEIDAWPTDVKARLSYNIYNATFPADVSCQGCKGLEWKSLFKPCASQRLFLADVLKGVDSVLYVDADTLFFAPIDEIWSILNTFNSTQFVAAASDTEIANSGVYHRRSIPFYGPNGINSGVLLMNLTRLRKSTWLESMTRYLIQYKRRLNLPDQDLINVYMHHHPENSYLLTCDWNYLSMDCIKCDQADKTGVALLHGFRQSFKNDQILPFKAIYTAFHEFKFGTRNIDRGLLQPIKRNLERVKSQKSRQPNRCHLKRDVLTKRIEDSIRQG